MKFKWTDVEQKAFDGNKQAVAQDTLLAYPDFNKCFDIRADDTSYKLGAVIKQGGKPIAFHSRKMTGLDKQKITWWV